MRIFLLIALLPLIAGGQMVTSLDDSGPGTLREVLSQAFDAQTISFSPDLSGGTITLTSGELLIENGVTIDGSNLTDAIVIDGGGQSRLLRIGDAFPGVKLISLELTGGLAAASDGGGAIYNTGTLGIERCTFHRNVSEGRGGAISNGGNLVVLNSTFTDNQSRDDGGAIYTISTASLRNCTISGNTALSPDALDGLLRSGGLGGILFENLKIYTLSNCIVSGNSGTPGAHNILPNSFRVGRNTENLIDANPLLAPLGNYGGPIPTMIPLNGSPAIDTGGSFIVATDQRGATRVTGFSIDIGSVEAASLPQFALDPILDPVVTLSSDRLQTAEPRQGLTLREAVALASDGSTITFDQALAGEVIALTSGMIRLNKNLLIEGGDLALTVSGSNTDRAFQVPAHSEVELRGLTITRGNAGSSSGGGLLNFGQLTLSHCQIDNCSATFGGAIAHPNGGRLLVTASSLTNNTASLDGGALFLAGRSKLQRSLFASNSATGNGGAIFASALGSPLRDLSNSTFFQNDARESGGAVANEGDLNMAFCTVVENSANKGGGLSGSVNLSGSIVSKNSAADSPDFESLDLNSRFNFLGGDPQLSPLQDNGGPTYSLLPLPNSPVIDPNSALEALPYEADQRGHSRLTGPTPDLGAVESNSVPLPTPIHDPVVTNPADLVRIGGEFDPNDLTLREALLFSRPGSIITFASAFPSAPVVLRNQGGNMADSAPLDPPHSLTIDGSLPSGRVRISGDEKSRIFTVADGLELSLRNLILQDGSSAGPGGAILVNGRLLLDTCDLTGCSASDGGALHGADSSDLIIRYCTIYANHALGFGGGIAALGSIEITRSTLAQNQSNSGGGLLVGPSSDASLIHVTISENEAVVTGGVENFGLLQIRSSIIGGNESLDELDFLDDGTTRNFGGNILNLDPLLQTLGNYGGPSPTMPPRGGSPAIDATLKVTFPLDQRGFEVPANETADSGATEYRGEEMEFALAFEFDSDRDGLSNGLEFAMGRDPYLAEASSPRDLVIEGDQLRFGIDPAYTDHVVLQLTRSTDLRDFDEVVLSNAEAPFEHTLNFVTHPIDGPKAFYRLEALLRNQ